MATLQENVSGPFSGTGDLQILDFLQDNRTVNSVKRYEDRLALILSWYDAWSASKRWMLLQQLVQRSSDKHRNRIHRTLEPSVPKTRLDFTRELPHHVCLKIFALLDPRSLCRASRVCWYWKILSEDNTIWMWKCLRFGWGLPRPPSRQETGVWKQHYVMCVFNLHWAPPKDMQSTLVFKSRGDDKERASSDSESAPSPTPTPPPEEPQVLTHSWADKRLEPWKAPSRRPEDLQSNKPKLRTRASSSSDAFMHGSKRTSKMWSSSSLFASSSNFPPTKLSTLSSMKASGNKHGKVSRSRSTFDKQISGSVKELPSETFVLEGELPHSAKPKEGSSLYAAGNPKAQMPGQRRGTLVQAWSGICKLDQGNNSSSRTGLEGSSAEPSRLPYSSGFHYCSDQSDYDDDYDAGT